MVVRLRTPGPRRALRRNYNAIIVPFSYLLSSLHFQFAWEVPADAKNCKIFYINTLTRMNNAVSETWDSLTTRIDYRCAKFRIYVGSLNIHRHRLLFTIPLACEFFKKSTTL